MYVRRRVWQVLWAEQQTELRRVKRDLIHDKREEERAYRQARYDDENWSRQWYLVGLLT